MPIVIELLIVVNRGSSLVRNAANAERIVIIINVNVTLNLGMVIFV